MSSTGSGHGHSDVEGRCEELIRISVQVSGGAERFEVAVEVESIERGRTLAKRAR